MHSFYHKPNTSKSNHFSYTCILSIIKQTRHKANTSHNLLPHRYAGKLPTQKRMLSLFPNGIDFDMPKQLGVLPLPIPLSVPIPSILPLPGICGLLQNGTLVKEVSLADLKGVRLTSKSDNGIDDAVSVSSTATSDIILPKATRHTIERGKMRGISLEMRSAKSTYKRGTRMETKNAFGEKTIKIYPPSDQPHGHVLWLKDNMITSQALRIRSKKQKRAK